MFLMPILSDRMCISDMIHDMTCVYGIMIFVLLSNFTMVCYLALLKSVFTDINL